MVIKYQFRFKPRFICSDPKSSTATLNNISSLLTILPSKLCRPFDLKNIFQGIKFPKQNIINANELLPNSGILLKIYSLWKEK